MQRRWRLALLCTYIVFFRPTASLGKPQSLTGNESDGAGGGHPAPLR